MPQSPGVRRARLVIVALGVLGANLGVRSMEAGPADATYGPARSCASCHKTIYTYWSESAHAQSLGKASYRDALAAAVASATDKEAVRRGCVWCHAPTALVTGDYELKQSLTREAITCDFCHTVADVDIGKPDHPFQLKPGRSSSGPSSM